MRMQNLIPCLYLRVNGDNGSDIVAEVGWNGTQLVTDGIDDDSKALMKDMWERIKRDYLPFCPEKTPEGILDFVFNRVNNGTYLNFIKRQVDDV